MWYSDFSAWEDTNGFAVWHRVPVSTRPSHRVPPEHRSNPFWNSFYISKRRLQFSSLKNIQFKSFYAQKLTLTNWSSWDGLECEGIPARHEALQQDSNAIDSSLLGGSTRKQRWWTTTNSPEKRGRNSANFSDALHTSSGRRISWRVDATAQPPWLNSSRQMPWT